MIRKSTEDITKPHSDKRCYRYIKLQNNLKCILIQDFGSKMAAACLYVRSGNLNDPEEVQGLAHFCEHMLFLGTAKYPKENTYNNFITTHGGSKNASTGEDYTQYFFSIQNDFLDQALDMFARFFREPLFDQSSTEREMNAVDNEFKKNLSDESRRQS